MASGAENLRPGRWESAPDCKALHPYGHDGWRPSGISASGRDVHEHYVPEMPLSEIARQCREDSTDWFPEDDNFDLFLHTLALGGEVGELQNLIKKVFRRSHTIDELRDRIKGELADILTYLANVVGVLDIDLEKEYRVKREYNKQRFGGGKARRADLRED